MMNEILIGALRAQSIQLWTLAAQLETSVQKIKESLAPREMTSKPWSSPPSNLLIEKEKQLADRVQQRIYASQHFCKEAEATILQAQQLTYLIRKRTVSNSLRRAPVKLLTCGHRRANILARGIGR